MGNGAKNSVYGLRMKGGGGDGRTLSSRATVRDPVAWIGRLSRWAPAQDRGDSGGVGFWEEAVVKVSDGDRFSPSSRDPVARIGRVSRWAPGRAGGDSDFAVCDWGRFWIGFQLIGALNRLVVPEVISTMIPTQAMNRISAAWPRPFRVGTA